MPILTHCRIPLDADHEPFARRLRRAPTWLLAQIVDCYLAEADDHAERARLARERWFAILDELDRRRRAGQAA